MAEEKKKGKGKKHLRKIITEHVPGDKSYVHHHVYADDAESDMEHPARPMATSGNADEAGAHVAEQFGAQEAGGAPPAEDAAAGGPAPGGEGPPSAPPGPAGV